MTYSMRTLLWRVMLCLVGCSTFASEADHALDSFVPNYDTPVNPPLQLKLETIHAGLRAKYRMTTNQTAVGLLDLTTLRLAMVHPDREEYAASVAKVGILLAYFELHLGAATNLDPQAVHELGLMCKA